MPYIHLPLQSGSDRILKLMGRKYTKDEYIKKKKKMKERIPNVAITTDIIVGFPGETKEDFKNTLEVVDTCKFDGAYTFIFSPREGTPASKMKDETPLEEKEERLYILNEKINIFVLDKDNDGIHFTDETFYLGMLKSWDFSLSVSKATFDTITKLDQDNVEGKNKQTITSGNELSVVYSENIDSSDAILSVGVPAMIGANKVVGLNIKPKTEVKSNGIFLDLIVMSNGQQTKITQDDKFVFTIPLWKHTNFAYLYISEELRKITAENAKDFFVEIVYS